MKQDKSPAYPPCPQGRSPTTTTVPFLHPPAVQRLDPVQFTHRPKSTSRGNIIRIIVNIKQVCLLHRDLAGGQQPLLRLDLRGAGGHMSRHSSTASLTSSYANSPQIRRFPLTTPLPN